MQMKLNELVNLAEKFPEKVPQPRNQLHNSNIAYLPYYIDVNVKHLLPFFLLKGARCQGIFLPKMACIQKLK